MRRVWVLLSLTACGGGAERMWLDLPSETSDEAAIVAVTLPDRTVLEAIDLNQSTRFELELTPEDTGRIEWLAYEATGSMHPVSGPVVPLDEGALGAVPLPTPRAAYHTTIEGGVAREWAMGPMSDALKAVRIDAPGNCRQYTATITTVDVPAALWFAMPGVGDDRYLISRTARAFRFAPPDVIEEVTMTPTVAVSGYHRADGRDYALGYDGVIYEVELELDSNLRLTAVTSTSGLREVRWADGPLDDLFVLSYSGHVMHWDGSTWTQLEQRVEASKGGVTRVGPREVLVGSGRSTYLSHIVDGEVTQIDLGDDGITGMKRLSDGSVIIAVGAGVLQRRHPDGTFEVVGQSELHLDLYSIHETPRGFVFGGVFGFFAEWIEGVGFCDAEQLGAWSVRGIIAVGEGYLLYGDVGNDTTNAVAYVR